MNLGEDGRNTGKLAEALDLYRAAESIYRKLGDQRSTARARRLAALVMCDQGDATGARALLEKSVADFMRAGDDKDLCEALYGLAYAYSLSDPRRASMLWGAGQRSRDMRGVRAAPPDANRESHEITAARAALGDETAFDLAWQQGAAMSLAQAAHFALQS